MGKIFQEKSCVFIRLSTLIVFFLMVSVVDYGKEIFSQTTDATGNVLFDTPATASLVIHAQGFSEVTKDLFMDSPVYGFCRDFNDYFTPGSFNNLRELLGNLGFEVKLKKTASTQ